MMALEWAPAFAMAALIVHVTLHIVYPMLKYHLFLWLGRYKPGEYDWRLETTKRWHAQRAELFIPVAATLLGLGVYTARTVYVNRDALLSLIRTPYLTPVWFFLAAGLYRLRGRHPILYGIIELFVGTCSILYSSLYPSANLSTELLSLSGGIYILIRGMDNVGKNLPNVSRTKWDKWF